MSVPAIGIVSGIDLYPAITSHSQTNQLVSHLSEEMNICSNLPDGCPPSLIALFKSVVNLKTVDQKANPSQSIGYLSKNGYFSDNCCEYCGINEPKCLVCCNVCKKWFCNGINNTPGSHAVYHLIKSRHKDVMVDNLLECRSCDCSNVFQLGYIVSDGERKTKSALLCRQPCPDCKNMDRHLSWDPDKWKPIIKDRRFVSWLVEQPSILQQYSSKLLTFKQINNLEKLWKNGNSKASFRSVVLLDSKIFEVKQKLMRFTDRSHYLDTFRPLVKLESNYEESKKDIIKVKFDVKSDGKIWATFKISKSDSKSVFGGDKIQLTYKGSRQQFNDWTGVGKVIRIFDDFSDRVCIEMLNRIDVPLHTDSKFVIDFVWKSVSYLRIQNALKSFAKDGSSVSPEIYSLLLGQQTEDVLINFDKTFPKQLSAPNLPKLNEFQNNAVIHSLQRNLTLIQGPPGTGKTVTSATIVYHLAKTGKKQVLVCAQSNTAVDQLTEKIEKTGLNVVRVYARKREAMEPVVHSALHKQVCRMDPEFEILYERKKNMVILSQRQESRYRYLKRYYETIILNRAQVICYTCVGAGDPRLMAFKFDSLLIDESTQSSEPECIVPLVLGAKQLILVGDHKQLGPVVKCNEAGREGLSQSLFERLVAVGISPICLEKQYRMHPSLSQFPSDVFYSGNLQNGVTAEERTFKGLNFRWPQPNHPMFFFRCEGEEELSSSGTSFLNRREASFVLNTITTLFFNSGIRPEQIGVITPYEGQKSYIFDYLINNGSNKFKQLYQQIEVGSVNAFQGREKDFIVMSCVRSNHFNELGFLKDGRRLNVALTRARYGLIIVGNPDTLSSDGLWNDLLTFYTKKNLLFDGPLETLIKK